MSEDGEQLPAPSSGLFLEVSFRRLLASCEEIAGGDDKGREDLREWRRSPVFHHYVETLEEQLADLQAAGKVDGELLQRYRHHTRALANQLERADVPAYCRLAAATAAAGLAAGDKPVGRPRVPAAVAPVLVPKLPAAGTSAAAAAAAPPRPVPLSDAARGRLSAHGRVQEALTDELAEMASAFKANTVAMENKVKERGQLLDSTEEALAKSVAGAKAAATKATAVHRRGRLNFCFTCLVLLIIGVGFAAMYMFIRLTSITGYRAQRGVQQPAAMAQTVTPAPMHDAAPDVGWHEEL